MSDIGKRISGILADPKVRAYGHFILLLCGAAFILAIALNWGALQGTPEKTDKLLHYKAGRIIAVASFLLAYICILARLLLVGEQGGSMTFFLLWLPAILAATLVASIAAAFSFALLKESLDMGRTGIVEWLDVTSTVEGAASLSAPIALIIALTPVLIPLDILMQLPKLYLSDIRTGIKSLDNYLREKKSHDSLRKQADVLVVEDDIICASAVMNFCRRLNLKCHHIATASEADAYLRANLNSVRLVILDNFLRIDDSGSRMTGSEWLMMIRDEFPINERPFFVVIISGHIEFIQEAASEANLVMQKPWSPHELQDFLKNNEIIAPGRG